MDKKTAVLFGATGLTGAHLLGMLARDEGYEKITVFARSDPGIESDKVECIITELDDLEMHEAKIRGNEVFCCLGTTIKKAGSKEMFRKVDLEFPEKIASIASKNQVPAFLVVSSIGADPQSSNFYLRTKGEMEEYVLKTPFEKVVILRPSMLLGKRSELRVMEEVVKLIAIPLRFILRGKFRKYRPIEAERVARVMVEIANTPKGKSILESHEIESFSTEQDLARKGNINTH
jgi:uncharacterized protein YbjT (DUF2867 family)